MPSPPNVVRLPSSPEREALVEAKRRGAEDLVRGLRDGERWAQRALLDRYTGLVERVLTHILGAHQDLDDLTQDVFLRAITRIDDLRDPAAISDWLAAFAANVAREAIRRKKRRWWQVLRPPEETPEIVAPLSSEEDRASMKAFYEVLDALDVDARVAFVLRYVEGMELTQVAAAVGVSLATIKRRIKAAEGDFCERARAHEALAEWIEEGTRWSQRTS